MKILIIIPAYNEEENIAGVVARLNRECPELDYLVVNDCSRDSTEEILRALGCNHINLPVNLGIGGSVQCGYLYAVQNGYDIAVQMDGDGQHDPQYLPALLKPILDGEADLVIGSRFIEKKGFQTSAMRRLGIRWIGGVIRFCCGLRITDATSGFRACSRAMAKYYSLHYAQDYPEPEAIMEAKLNGFRVCEVPVAMKERQGGVSSIGGVRSLYYMVKVTLALLLCRMRGRERRGKRE